MWMFTSLFDLSLQIQLPSECDGLNPFDSNTSEVNKLLSVRPYTSQVMKLQLLPLIICSFFLAKFTEIN